MGRMSRRALTYCSFVDSDRPLGGGLLQNTIVILEGHHEQLAACNICLEKKLIGSNGEFLSWPVPEEHEPQYAPHVGRSIPGEEARVLFDGMSTREWDAHHEGVTEHPQHWDKGARS